MSRGAPLPPYIKEPRGRGGRPRRTRQGGVLRPPGVGRPPLALVEKERGRGKRKGGRRPPFLVLFGLGGRGSVACPGRLLFSLMAHVGPITPRGGGVPVTPRYSGKIPVSPGTIPISKYRLPIYQSLCLDHFETRRHVLDHIRDSEQPSVHKNI